MKQEAVSEQERRKWRRESIFTETPKRGREERKDECVGEKERKRRGAHVQSLRAACSLWALPATFPTLPLPPFFPCLPDKRLPPEQTLQGKGRTDAPWNRNTTWKVKRGGKKTLLHLLSFLYFLPYSASFASSPPSRCLLPVSERTEWQKKWGLFFFLGTFLGCIPPFGDWRQGLSPAQYR